MANIKSAKKRILVNRTKAERNKSIRSAVKTAIKKVEVAVVNKDKETAVNALVNVNIGVSCFIDRDRLRRAILRAKMTFLAHIAFNRRGADVSRIIDRFFRIIIGQTAVFH